MLSIRQKQSERLHLETELPTLVVKYKYKDYTIIYLIIIIIIIYFTTF